MAFPLAAILAGASVLGDFMSKKRAARSARRAQAESFRLARDRDRITPIQNQIRAGILRSYGFPESSVRALEAPQMDPDESMEDVGPGGWDLLQGLLGATQYLPPRGGAGSRGMQIAGANAGRMMGAGGRIPILPSLDTSAITNALTRGRP